MAQPTAVEGRTIGRYRVLKHVATGGMAEIYLAHYDDERGVRREAVVKVILRERARDRKFVQMFLDEARVSSTFIHPNIAQLFEVGRDADTYFYAMEYVAGDNVRALIERSLRARMYMPLPVTLAIGTRVAAALHYAHERSSSSGEKLNAVHRDVTPSNIMLGFDGAVKLLDFGIARADSRAQMTQSGTVKGKFAYMSPEQCKGVGVDRRTDVFALGIVLYELSTQRRAFRAESDFETMERILRGDLVPPHRIHADYPRELEAILMRALALDPAERYQTAAELGQALAGFQLARGLPNDDAAVTAIMRQLFVGDAPPEPEIEVVAAPPLLPPRPSPMSLASMLAATVEPAVAAPSPTPPTPPPTAPAPPRPLAIPARPPTPPPMMAVPPPARGRRPSTTPSRPVADVAPAPTASASAPASAYPSGSPAFAPTPSVSMPAMIHAPPLPPPEPWVAPAGTPPAMDGVQPDDDMAAAFARHTGSMPVITLEAAPDLPAMPTPMVTPMATPPTLRRPTPVPATVMRPTPVPWTPPRAVGSATVAAPVAESGERLGLWLALAAIVAVGGVVAAVLVLSSLGIF